MLDKRLVLRFMYLVIKYIQYQLAAHYIPPEADHSQRAASANAIITAQKIGITFSHLCHQAGYNLDQLEKD